jgi:hypothetical protein
MVTAAFQLRVEEPIRKWPSSSSIVAESNESPPRKPHQ